jgi:two-component system CheB/CheR fusion protein
VEELQAANTELAALNSELEGRTSEMNRLDFFHRSLLDSLQDGIIVLDRTGAVTTWNQRAERLWGLRADQAINRPFFALPIGNVAQAARPAFETVLATPETAGPTEVAFRVPGSDGRGTLRLLPLRAVGGEVIGIVGIITAPDGAGGRGAR